MTSKSGKAGFLSPSQLLNLYTLFFRPALCSCLTPFLLSIVFISKF